MIAWCWWSQGRRWEVVTFWIYFQDTVNRSCWWIGWGYERKDWQWLQSFWSELRDEWNCHELRWEVSLWTGSKGDFNHCPRETSRLVTNISLSPAASCLSWTPERYNEQFFPRPFWSWGHGGGCSSLTPQPVGDVFVPIINYLGDKSWERHCFSSAFCRLLIRVLSHPPEGTCGSRSSRDCLLLKIQAIALAISWPVLDKLFNFFSPGFLIWK